MAENLLKRAIDKARAFHRRENNHDFTTSDVYPSMLVNDESDSNGALKNGDKNKHPSDATQPGLSIDD